MKYTTIMITHETKDLLTDLKIHPRQSYNDVIKELVKIKKIVDYNEKI